MRNESGPNKGAAPDHDERRHAIGMKCENTTKLGTDLFRPVHGIYSLKTLPQNKAIEVKVVSSRKNFVSTLVVSLALFALLLVGLLLDDRATFGGADQIAKALHLSVTSKTAAIWFLSLLSTVIPFLAHRAIRLAYSVHNSDAAHPGTQGIHQLLHPIYLFLQW